MAHTHKLSRMHTHTHCWAWCGFPLQHTCTPLRVFANSARSTARTKTLNYCFALNWMQISQSVTLKPPVIDLTGRFSRLFKWAMYTYQASDLDVLLSCGLDALVMVGVYATHTHTHTHARGLVF